MDIDIQSKISDLIGEGVKWAPKVLFAIVALIIGLWIIGKIAGVLNKSLERSGLDLTLRNFLASLASIFMKIMLFFTVASMVGINTTSFVAIIGALMVGVGMALNGTIGHFASGVMLMIFRPFKVGDLVDIGGGHVGTVESINAFNTTLETLDNKRIIVANSNVTGNTITNISGQGIIGVEMDYKIGYSESIDKARAAILKVGQECPYVVDDPAQGVVVSGHEDNGIKLSTRPFCKSEHYWDTLFYMQENVKKEFDAQGIAIPFPQMDVRVSQN